MNKRHPIYRLLSARLALVVEDIDCSSLWFYGNKAPDAEAVIRKWAADHADEVVVSSAAGGISVDHRTKYESIVAWYPTFAGAGTEAA